MFQSKNVLIINISSIYLQYKSNIGQRFLIYLLCTYFNYICMRTTHSYISCMYKKGLRPTISITQYIVLNCEVPRLSHLKKTCRFISNLEDFLTNVLFKINIDDKIQHDFCISSLQFRKRRAKKPLYLYSKEP